MEIEDLKSFGVDVSSEVCKRCGGVVELTPKSGNPLIGTCEGCGTTYPWLNLKEVNKV